VTLGADSAERGVRERMMAIENPIEADLFMRISES
jgi:hypothetical protein